MLIDCRTSFSRQPAQKIQKGLASRPHHNLLRSGGDAARPPGIQGKRFPQSGISLMLAVGHDDFTPVEDIAHMTPPDPQVGGLRVRAVGPEIKAEMCGQRCGRKQRAARIGGRGLPSKQNKISALRFAFQISLHAKLLIGRLHRCAAHTEILREPADGGETAALPKLSGFHRLFQGIIKLAVQRFSVCMDFQIFIRQSVHLIFL